MLRFTLIFHEKRKIRVGEEKYQIENIVFLGPINKPRKPRTAMFQTTLLKRGENIGNGEFPVSVCVKIKLKHRKKYALALLIDQDASEVYVVLIFYVSGFLLRKVSNLWAGGWKGNKQI